MLSLRPVSSSCYACVHAHYCVDDALRNPQPPSGSMGSLQINGAKPFCGADRVLSAIQELIALSSNIDPLRLDTTDLCKASKNTSWTNCDASQIVWRGLLWCEASLETSQSLFSSFICNYGEIEWETFDKYNRISQEKM